jgi:hypothetical protein
MALRVAEGNHPSVVLQQEVQNCARKSGSEARGAQVAQIRPGRRQEQRKHLVIRGDPPQGLQGQDMRSFGLHFPGSPSAR